MAAATLPHLTNILGLDALPLPPAILTLFFNLSFFNQRPLRGRASGPGSVPPSAPGRLILGVLTCISGALVDSLGYVFTSAFLQQLF
jgi:hypothetical protein